jgi:F-type H+-transporting ATPase subunit alpha
MVEVLKQKNGEPVSLEKQVAAIYAANQKFFRDVPVNQVTAVEKAFVDFLDSNFAASLASIKKSGQLSDDAKKELGQAMENFRAAHGEYFSAAK